MTTVTVTTAVDTTAQQQKSMRDTLAKKLGAVTVNFMVDAAQIAGVKVMVGSHELDASGRTRLDKIKSQLLTNLS